MDILDIFLRNIGIGWWLPLMWVFGYNSIDILTYKRSRYLPDNWIIRVDRYIPMFEPGMDVLYLSVFVLILYPFVVIRDPKAFWTFALSFGLVMAVSFLVFALYPVKMRRPPAKFWLLKITQATDKASNTIPSLHASMATLPFLVAVLYGGWEWPVVGIWSLGILASTVLVKQHYLVDIISGVLLALAVWAFFYMLLPML